MTLSFTPALAGLHPHGMKLTDIEGATCGNCFHLVTRRMGGTYLKCRAEGRRLTGGPGTDLRKKWRGCVDWHPNDESVPDYPDMVEVQE